MSVVVNPSAREAFTPRELAAAYEDFIERGPQYLDAETGIKASAYRSGKHVLIVYEESETGLTILVHPGGDLISGASIKIPGTFTRTNQVAP